MPISQPQPVLAPLTESAIFLVYALREDVGDAGVSTVRALLGDFTGLVRTVASRGPGGEVSAIVGIGAEAWPTLFDSAPPAHLHPFRELAGGRHHAPSTPGDVLVHIRSRRADLCFELARLINDRLAGVAIVADEVHGFRCFDGRDLLGFVDGTENPEGSAREAAVLVGDDDPAWAAGSYVVVQKYLHDLAAWTTLSIEEQQRAIGRTKSDNVEAADDDKAANAHIALTVINDDDGNQLQILRDNMPFGRFGTEEFGTYFIGYARNPAVIEQMLTNMFIGKPEGTTDRILDFSTAVTGSLFFIPSIEFIDELN